MIPTVGLLIPCYNAGPFLPRLADSIRAQAVPFDTILCYDDGSTDDTVAVARRLGLEIITGNPNRGAAHARNQLGQRATTEWIHFQDADDPLLPGFLARLKPLCTTEVDAVCCDADWVDAVNSGVHLAWRYRSAELARDPVAELLLHPMSLNNTILRADCWRAVGGCDESLAMWEDADVHFRLALAGARFRHVPEVLTKSLRRGESSSHDYPRNGACRLQSLETYLTDPRCDRLRPAIAAEAERVAAALLQIGDEAGAQRAIRLCHQLGRRVPTTNHPVLRLARHVFPPITLLRWQNRRRTPPPARSTSAPT